MGLFSNIKISLQKELTGKKVILGPRDGIEPIDPTAEEEEGLNSLKQSNISLINMTHTRARARIFHAH